MFSSVITKSINDRVVVVSKQVFSFVAIVSTLRTGNKPANSTVHRLNLKSCLKRLVSAYIHKPYSRSLMKSTKIPWLILRLWQPFTKFEVTVVGDHPWWSPRKLVWLTCWCLNWLLFIPYMDLKAKWAKVSTYSVVRFLVIQDYSQHALLDFRDLYQRRNNTSDRCRKPGFPSRRKRK